MLPELMMSLSRLRFVFHVLDPKCPQIVRALAGDWQGWATLGAARDCVVAVWHSSIPLDQQPDWPFCRSSVLARGHDR